MHTHSYTHTQTYAFVSIYGHHISGFTLIPHRYGANATKIPYVISNNT